MESYYYVMYVDGSYSKSVNIAKGAFIFLAAPSDIAQHDVSAHSRLKPIYAQPLIFTNDDLNRSRNVGGELYSVAVGMSIFTKMLKEKGILGNKVTIEICYDYRGIADFLNGVWNKPTSPITKLYISIMRQIEQDNPNLELVFTKIASHTGTYWNEVVDQLASRPGIPSPVAHCSYPLMTV